MIELLLANEERWLNEGVVVIPSIALVRRGMSYALVADLTDGPQKLQRRWLIGMVSSGKEVEEAKKRKMLVQKVRSEGEGA